MTWFGIVWSVFWICWLTFELWHLLHSSSCSWIGEELGDDREEKITQQHIENELLPFFFDDPPPPRLVSSSPSRASDLLNVDPLVHFLREFLREENSDKFCVNQAEKTEFGIREKSWRHPDFAACWRLLHEWSPVEEVEVVRRRLIEIIVHRCSSFQHHNTSTYVLTYHRNLGRFRQNTCIRSRKRKRLIYSCWPILNHGPFCKLATRGVVRGQIHHWCRLISHLVAQEEMRKSYSRISICLVADIKRIVRDMYIICIMYRMTIAAKANCHNSLLNLKISSADTIHHPVKSSHKTRQNSVCT